MNVKELAKVAAEKHGITDKQAHAMVTGLLDGIAEAITKGEEVNLPGFGKFKVKDVPERGGRNPSTGEPITIAASKKVSFAPAKALKDRL